MHFDARNLLSKGGVLIGCAQSKSLAEQHVDAPDLYRMASEYRMREPKSDGGTGYRVRELNWGGGCAF